MRLRRPFLALVIAAGASVNVHPQSNSGAILGRVIDERGQPVANAQIFGLLRRVPAGLSIQRAASTDVTGRYRLGELPVGEYVVLLRVLHDTVKVVFPRPSACVAFPPAPPGPPWPVHFMPFVRIPVLPDRPIGSIYSRLPRDLRPPLQLPEQPHRTYDSGFFPGVRNLEEASTITIRRGEERRDIDLTLRTVASTSVRGRLLRGRGRPIGNATEIALHLPGASSGYPVARSHFDGRSEFIFSEIPPGSYILEVQLQRATSCDTLMRDAEDIVTRRPVHVPVEGLSDLPIMIDEGVSVSGSVEFLGSISAPPEFPSYMIPVSDPEYTRDKLASWEGSAPRFRFVGVEPGRYFMPFPDHGRQWFLQSVVSGSIDLAAEAFDVGPAGLEGVHIVLAARPSPLSGRVVMPTGTPGAAVVAVFPADSRLWREAHPFAARYRSTPATNGVFRIGHLPPGAYLATAVSDELPKEWTSEDVLRALAVSATRVTMSSQTPTEVELPLRRLGR